MNMELSESLFNLILHIGQTTIFLFVCFIGLLEKKNNERERN